MTVDKLTEDKMTVDKMTVDKNDSRQNAMLSLKHFFLYNIDPS